MPSSSIISIQEPCGPCSGIPGKLETTQEERPCSKAPNKRGNGRRRAPKRCLLHFLTDIHITGTTDRSANDAVQRSSHSYHLYPIFLSRLRRGRQFYVRQTVVAVLSLYINRASEMMVLYIMSRLN